MSFVPLGKADSIADLNQLEPSFMYTRLFKNVLIEMEFSRESVHALVSFCRENTSAVSCIQKVIDEFEGSYRSDQAIWWYTRECFTYQMLNQALRLLKADIILNMGFFISDLHHQIQLIDQQRLSDYRE